MTERYLLVPCMGVGVARDHLVDVREEIDGVETCLGFTIVEDAIARFGIDNLRLSGSHGVCPECFARYQAWDTGDTPAPPPRPFDDMFRVCVLVQIIEKNATFAALMAAFPSLGIERISDHFARLEAAGYIRRGKRAGWGAYRATPAGIAALKDYDASRVSQTTRRFLAAKAAAGKSPVTGLVGSGSSGAKQRVRPRRTQGRRTTRRDTRSIPDGELE